MAWRHVPHFQGLLRGVRHGGAAHEPGDSDAPSECQPHPASSKDSGWWRCRWSRERGRADIIEIPKRMCYAGLCVRVDVARISTYCNAEAAPSPDVMATLYCCFRAMKSCLLVGHTLQALMNLPGRPLNSENLAYTKQNAIQ